MDIKEKTNELLKELLTSLNVPVQIRIKAQEILDDKESEELALREEIETLKKIIDKCNTTYYNANAKTQVVLDGTVKAVEECVKQRSKKDGND